MPPYLYVMGALLTGIFLDGLLFVGIDLDQQLLPEMIGSFVLRLAGSFLIGLFCFAMAYWGWTREEKSYIPVLVPIGAVLGSVLGGLFGCALNSTDMIPYIGRTMIFLWGCTGMVAGIRGALNVRKALPKKNRRMLAALFTVLACLIGYGYLWKHS